MTPEGLIRNQICSYLSRKRCFFFIHDSVGIFDPVRKVYRRSNSPYRILGVSDILGIWRGRPLAIEVKSKKGQLSDHQRIFLENWRREGGIGIVAKSIEEVKIVLEDPLLFGFSSSKPELEPELPLTLPFVKEKGLP